VLEDFYSLPWGVKIEIGHNQNPAFHLRLKPVLSSELDEELKCFGGQVAKGVACPELVEGAGAGNI